jgi:diaminopimelate decarboxylase
MDAVFTNSDHLQMQVALAADYFGGELEHTAAAVPDRPLAFGGPGKPADELAIALKVGPARFHVESPHELAQLDAAARAAGQRADVLLRVNPPGHSGGDQAQLVMGGGRARLVWICSCWGPAPDTVRLRGLHAHLASGLGADGLLDGARRLLEFGRDWCAARGVREPEFNLGGGMAVDYARPDAPFAWAAYGRGLARLARDGETLRIEPGRAVTAYCGWYLTRVLDVKRSHGEAFAVVAGGTHHLRMPAAKDHDQPCAVISVPNWSFPGPRPGVSAQAVTITGQLCTPKDGLARRVMVKRLRAGDVVTFGLAGAYAWNISHHSFLMHPPPAFHYLT